MNVRNALPGRSFGSLRLSASALLALTCAVLAAGCGGGSDRPALVRVSGVVTYNGKPLPNGSVTFHPADPQKGRPGQATIGSDGTFNPSTFAPGDGLMAGSYSISVASTEPNTEALEKDKGTGIGGKSAIPEKYSDPATSGLRETIGPDDRGKVLKLELKD